MRNSQYPVNPNFQSMLPSYWLNRPPMDIDRATRRLFDRLLQDLLAANSNPLIDYRLSAPRWQFLCYAAENYSLTLHGSGNAQIAIFEPRQPVDLGDFSNQKAVYATEDGILAMFFAIVDRDRYQMWVNNACIRLVDASGQTSLTFYVFSVSKHVLIQQPWRTGTVYLLPKNTFAQQPPIPFGAFQVHIAQSASPEPVRPIARLEVTPQDFPFLAQIRPHDDARIQEYGQAMQTGAPWPDEE